MYFCCRILVSFIANCTQYTFARVRYICRTVVCQFVIFVCYISLYLVAVLLIIVRTFGRQPSRGSTSIELEINSVLIGRVADRLLKSCETSSTSQGRVDVGPRSDRVRRRELVASRRRRLFDVGFWPRRRWTLSSTLGCAVDCGGSDVTVPLLDAAVVAVELSGN